MHIEAGVRSYDRTMPEEINRIVVDHISNILCCPTRGAFEILVAEGVGINPRGWITITGDIMRDMITKYEDISLKQSNIIDHLGLHVNKYYLATIHRPSNTDNKHILENILIALGKLGDRVIFPLHPRTRAAIFANKISCPENIWFIDPLGYFDMIALIKFAKKVITDSGGLQKEAYFLGTPCVTVRDTTEWVETLAGYWNICTGVDPQRIIDGVMIIPDKNRINLNMFGDGNATEEICNCIDRVERSVRGCANGYH